jgi:hypothetical protein
MQQAVFPTVRILSADRKVSPGYGFTAVPECGNCISAPPHPPGYPVQKYSFCTPPETFRSTDYTQCRFLKQKIHLPRREGSGEGGNTALQSVGFFTLPPAPP